MLKFILPTEQNRDEVISFYDEIEKSGGECIGIGNYKNYDLAVWIFYMEKYHQKISTSGRCIFYMKK